MDIDRNAPTTKGDLLDLREELRRDFTQGLSNLREELVEAIHDGQTEVLRAFYGFTQTVQARFTQQDETEVSLKRRMTTLESRILEIEKRLNMPPSAA
ncbi:MAG TPA: hypothetical protein VE178_12385 [Silvibacterium sp.]|nr:hypothetical protein [Silvibacterium sp.]